MKKILIIIFSFIFTLLNAQSNFQVEVITSKLLNTYDFVEHLSDYHPENEYKKLFNESEFNNKYHKDLLAQLDTLRLYESYSFQDYPYGQKQGVNTNDLLKRNLIESNTIQEFKKLSFGIVPVSELTPLATIISAFVPVYEQLIFNSYKNEFKKQLSEFSDFVESQKLNTYLEMATAFYGTDWDYSVPVKCVIIPSIKDSGFSATSLQNYLISEIPLKFKDKNILFSVFLHELFHTIYDEQNLNFKTQIKSWFQQHSSSQSHYAYLLLNEAIATSLGNGYVYEKLSGKLDDHDWYTFKYINQMAKKIYPIVKEYAENRKSIDKHFVDSYVDTYEKNYSEWINELEHLFTYRFVISESKEDFKFFKNSFNYANIIHNETNFDLATLTEMSKTPITKVIIISNSNEQKIRLIKNTFAELKDIKFEITKEFIHIFLLDDKTLLFVINKQDSALKNLFNNNFEENIISHTRHTKQEKR